jgi:hypothetical protein
MRTIKATYRHYEVLKMLCLYTLSHAFLSIQFIFSQEGDVERNKFFVRNLHSFSRTCQHFFHIAVCFEHFILPTIL